MSRTKRERRILGLLLACAVVLSGALALTAAGRVQRETEYIQTQRQASALLEDCFARVRAYKEAREIPMDELDFHKTGMIGTGYSGITTTLGAIEAKRTTAWPEMGALCVRLLHEAGIKPGDVVGAGFSGSFPAMDLAVIAACQAMDVDLVYISSVGASTYGANNPELTFPEMAHLLVEDGLLKTDSAAVTLGGDQDIGGSMEPALVDEITQRLEAAGLPLIREPDFHKNLDLRQQIYREKGPIRCFVAVGGNITSMGVGESGIGLGQGLLSPGQVRRLTESSGLVQRYLAEGMPVINLLNIKKLVSDYGMPYDPAQWPEPEDCAVYYRSQYPAAPIALGLAAAAVLLALCRRARSSGKTGEKFT